LQNQLAVAISVPPAAVTAAATSTPTTSAPASISAATASSTATHRTSLVHDQSAPHEIFSVKSFDGFFGVRVVREFGETKTARLPSETIAQQTQLIGLHSNLRKQRGHILFRSLKRQVPHVQFLHERAPCSRPTHGVSLRLKNQVIGR
jgi:hypothetical protein